MAGKDKLNYGSLDRRARLAALIVQMLVLEEAERKVNEAQDQNRAAYVKRATPQEVYESMGAYLQGLGRDLDQMQEEIEAVKQAEGLTDIEAERDLRKCLEPYMMVYAYQRGPTEMQRHFDGLAHQQEIKRNAQPQPRQ